MRQEKRSLIPTEELERVRFYVSTTSDRIHAQRLRMLKDLAAEVLEHRRKSTEPLDLEGACNALVQHLIMENIKHPDSPASGFTMDAEATVQGKGISRILYTVNLEITGAEE